MNVCIIDGEVRGVGGGIGPHWRLVECSPDCTPDVCAPGCERILLRTMPLDSLMVGADQRVCARTEEELAAVAFLLAAVGWPARPNCVALGLLLWLVATMVGGR